MKNGKKCFIAGMRFGRIRSELGDVLGSVVKRRKGIALEKTLDLIDAIKEAKRGGASSKMLSSLETKAEAFYESLEVTRELGISDKGLQPKIKALGASLNAAANQAKKKFCG